MEDHEVIVGMIGKTVEVLPVDELSVTAFVNGKILGATWRMTEASLSQ